MSDPAERFDYSYFMGLVVDHEADPPTKKRRLQELNFASLLPEQLKSREAQTKEAQAQRELLKLQLKEERAQFFEFIVASGGPFYRSFMEAQLRFQRHKRYVALDRAFTQGYDSSDVFLARVNSHLCSIRPSECSEYTAELQEAHDYLEGSTENVNLHLEYISAILQYGEVVTQCLTERFAEREVRWAISQLYGTLSRHTHNLPLSVTPFASDRMLLPHRAWGGLTCCAYASILKKWSFEYDILTSSQLPESILLATSVAAVVATTTTWDSAPSSVTVTGAATAGSTSTSTSAATDPSSVAT